MKNCVYKALMNCIEKHNCIDNRIVIIELFDEMADLKKNRFLIFVSLIIFPASALDVILSGAHQDFKQKSEIKFNILFGKKTYLGTLNQLTYEADVGISKVIVYITSRSRCIEILRPAGVARDTRSQIARELREMRRELVFLGFENFDDDEYHFIGAFIFEKIRFHPKQRDYTIETIGEDRFDQFYHCNTMNYQKFQENAQICGGTLLARLRSIPHGAHTPVGSNHKQIKLFGYQPFVKGVTWTVCVENNTYVPNVNLSDPTYNFVIKYPNKKICLLIISGKEYTAVTTRGNRSSQRASIRKYIDAMKKNDEVLIIMGVFNFDWTEVDIVTQIILRHSEGSESSVDNVFICGYGMFNTYYLYDYEGGRRCIQRQPNSYVSEVIEVVMGEEVRKRVINVYYYHDDEWKGLDVSISLSNGRYCPEFKVRNFTLPRLHKKVVYIVYDRTEMNNPIDVSIVGGSVEELGWSGISVVFIEAINFGLDDIHIIAEWIDCHNGVTNLEQIAVLGGGIFDTIFQSESNTYNTFLNTKKTALETIRNAYVRSGYAKSVSIANIDYSKFEVWSYPMTTSVNGFYEPDLIPDKNWFDTIGGRKIFFIITSAYHFQQISAIKNLRLTAELFRQNIHHFLPNWRWSVYLVHHDNFGERDYHLFAELLKRQTNDKRSIEEVVRILNYGTGPAVYQYKDTAPFEVDSANSLMRERFTDYFGKYLQTST